MKVKLEFVSLELLWQVPTPSLHFCWRISSFCRVLSLWTGSLDLFGGKKIARKVKGRGERACRHTFEAAIPPSCNYLAEHLSVRSLSVNQFRAWVTPGKINGKTSVFCSVSKQIEMDREFNCRFCKKSLFSSKRINTVPVVGFSRNKTLLVDSGQDSVVLAQAFDSSRFPLVQGESFSDLSCLTCALRAVRLASSVSNSPSPCNERTWNAKGTDTIMTSPEREPPKTSTKNQQRFDRRQELHLWVVIPHL